MASLTKINNDPKYKTIKNIQQQIEEKFYPQLLALSNAGDKWLKSIEDMTISTRSYLSTLNEFSKSSPENCEGANIASNETKEIARNLDLVLKEYTESVECIKKFVAKLQVQSKKEKNHIATMKDSFDQQVKKKNSLLKKKKINDNEVQEFLNVSLEEHENIARIRYEFVARFSREITKKQIDFYRNALQLIDPSFANTRHNTLSKDEQKMVKKNSIKEDENLEKQLIAAAEEIKHIVQETPNNNIINIQEIHTTDTESLPSQKTPTTCELQHEELSEVPYIVNSQNSNDHILNVEEVKNFKKDNDYDDRVLKQKQLAEEFEEKIKKFEIDDAPPVMPRVSKTKKEFEHEIKEHNYSYQEVTSPIHVHKEPHTKNHSSSYPGRIHYQERIPIPAPDYDEKTIPYFKYNTWEYGNLVMAKVYYSPRSKAELGLIKSKKYFFMKGGNRGWIFCRDLDTSRSGWCPSDFVELYK